jgi:tight adherence protein B
MRRRVVRARLARLAGTGQPVPGRASVLRVRRPGVWLAVGVALIGGLAGVLGGPVAAVVAMWYAVLALRAARRAVAERAVGARRIAALDLIGGLAADLRAGAAPAMAMEATRAALETGVPDPAVGRTR